MPGARVTSIGLFLGLTSALVLAGCPKPKPDAQSDAGTSTTPSASVATTTQEKPADGAHGRELVATFQCNRCHDGTGHPAAPQNKHCVHCHKDIMEDRFQAPAASIARWKPRVKELADAPSLEATGKRFSRTWIESYLLTPKDLRPHLHQYMPRLALTRADAKDIAAYLVPEADPTPVKDPPETKGADIAQVTKPDLAPPCQHQTGGGAHGVIGKVGMFCSISLQRKHQLVVGILENLLDDLARIAPGIQNFMP